MRYSYTATSEEGEVKRGEREAPSEETVLDELRRQRLAPVSVRAVGRGRTSGSTGEKRRFVLFAKIKPVERITLTEHLQTMLHVGFPIVEAVETLRRDAENPLLQNILLQMRYDLEKGAPLSRTFARHPKVFSKIFVNLVKAGEASGTLEQVLANLVVQLKKDYELKKKIRSASVYPVFLLILTLIVIVGMLTFVLPKLANIFVQAEIELPLPTRIMLAVSNVFSANPFLTIAALAGLIIFFIFFRRFEAVSRGLELILSHVPVVRELLRKIALARFARTLSALIASGISILDAVSITAEAVGRRSYAAALLAVRKEIERGVPLARALERYPKLFPHMTASMVDVGERTGTVDQVLANLANFYEGEVDGALRDLVTFLEPALLFVVGAVIGFLALSIITPIYQLVGSIG